jgi:hypothetical protein
MKSIQRCFVLASLALVSLAGCAAPEMNAASEPEPVEEASDELQETTCTTASSVVNKTLTGTAPTTCGTFQQFVASSPASYNNNPATCPFQFVVEVARSNNSPIGSGYHFEGVPSTFDILNPDGGKAVCESKQASYAAWAFSAGTWTEVGTVWMKGHWDNSPDTLFPCRWGIFNSSGSLNNVPANATKIRIAAAAWSESGTKGADGTDTYRGVVAGIGAGESCPPQ